MRQLLSSVLAVVVGAGLALSGPTALAQAGKSPFREVEPMSLPLDRDGVWTLHFAYLPPRIMSIDTAAGPRKVWYMVYQVWNTSDTPVTFVPEFELVTKDGRLQTFLDEPFPAVVQKIKEVEDKTGAYNLQTSIAISKTKIPVTKPDSIPRAVYGVAVWLDVPDKAATTNNFSVYVSGLSNGLATAEIEGGGERISRKTLQIDFVRPTDDARAKLNDIRVNENNGLGAEKWIYRVIPAKNVAAATPAPAPKADDKKDEGK